MADSTPGPFRSVRSGHCDAAPWQPSGTALRCSSIVAPERDAVTTCCMNPDKRLSRLFHSRNRRYSSWYICMFKKKKWVDLCSIYCNGHKLYTHHKTENKSEKKVNLLWVQQNSFWDLNEFTAEAKTSRQRMWLEFECDFFYCYVSVFVLWIFFLLL